MKISSGSPRSCIFISLWFLKLLNLHCIIKVVCFVYILVFPSIIIHMWFVCWRKYFTLKLKMFLSWVSERDTCLISSLYWQHCDLFPLLFKIGLDSFQPSNRLFLPLEQPLICISFSILLQYLCILSLGFIDQCLFSIFPDLSYPIAIIIWCKTCSNTIFINSSLSIIICLRVLITNFLLSGPASLFLVLCWRHCCDSSSHAWFARVACYSQEWISHIHVMMMPSISVSDQSQLFLEEWCLAFEEVVYFLVHRMGFH